MRQIGLLVPRSTLYPTINFDLVEGLRTSLSFHGIDNVEIKTANIGIGGKDNEIYAACEKMLFDGVFIIAGYINPYTAELLQPLFSNAGGLLITLDAGYHIPTPQYNPGNAFTISLQGSLACRALPEIAAAKGNTRFAFVSSFYDSGYRAPWGFFNGLQETNAQIVFNYVTQLKKKDFTIEPLTTFLAQDPGCAVMATFCADMTDDLFNSMATNPEYTQHNIYGSPFVAEEFWLAKMRYPGMDITSCVTWASDIDTEANRDFIAQMKKKNRPANVFSLLSWEAGIVIAKTIEADNTTDRIALLENSTYTSPRGIVTIDKTTHNANAPLYEATIVKSGDVCALVTGKAIDTIDGQRAKYLHEIATFEGGSTSWFNVYACMD